GAARAAAAIAGCASRSSRPTWCASCGESRANRSAERYAAAMDLFDALGANVTSSLNDKRASVPRKLLCAHDAAAQLAGELRAETSGRSALVLFDARTGAVAGQDLISALLESGFTVNELLVPDQHGHTPACDETTKASLAAALPRTDVLIGAGSGVISDLTKWLAFDAKRPAAIFGTAASMN